MEQESAAGFPHQPGRWRSGETRSLGNSDAPEQSGACSWVTRLSTKRPRDIITHSSRYTLPTICLYIIASCLHGRFKASWCKPCKVEIAVVHLFRCTLLQGLSQGSCTGCFTPRRWLLGKLAALPVFPKALKSDMKVVPLYVIRGTKHRQFECSFVCLPSRPALPLPLAHRPSEHSKMHNLVKL